MHIGEGLAPWYVPDDFVAEHVSTNGPAFLPIVKGSRVPIYVGGVLVWHLVTDVSVEGDRFTYQVERDDRG